jgi:hypothetical protein
VQFENATTRQTRDTLTSMKKRVTKASRMCTSPLIRSTHGRGRARMRNDGPVRPDHQRTHVRVERHNPVACFPHGDALVVIASAGGSDENHGWYWNLAAVQPCATAGSGR